MKSSRRTQQPSCSLPLPPVILFGSLITAGFFVLIFLGPLDYPILRRYCLSHPVAIASVSLFFVGLTGLVLKWTTAHLQARIAAKSAAVLRRLVMDGQDVIPKERPQWLVANWESQPARIQESWFGARVGAVLALQISRGRRNQLESDLQSMAEQDGDRQHDSYSLMRIINWAMPMLGFLGTVLGISQTLGQLDTKMLATQQQDAMNQLTAGLYVAFDTTAIALVLTVFLMFVQFAISRLEQNLLAEIEFETNASLVQYLSADLYEAQDSLLSPVREMIESLIEGVRSLVHEQSALWHESLTASQQQWAAWTESLSGKIHTQFGDGLGDVLHKHVAELNALQDEGNRQQELRLQQWQTTFSDQARLIQGQQKEVIKQTDSLQGLIKSTTDLRKLEETIHDSVARMENVSRIEEATLCVGEAVAVLATCLERAGVIRGAPLRPRAVKKGGEADFAGKADSGDGPDAGEAHHSLPFTVRLDQPADSETQQRKAA